MPYGDFWRSVRSRPPPRLGPRTAPTSRPRQQLRKRRTHLYLGHVTVRQLLRLPLGLSPWQREAGRAAVLRGRERRGARGARGLREPAGMTMFILATTVSTIAIRAAIRAMVGEVHVPVGEACDSPAGCPSSILRVTAPGATAEAIATAVEGTVHWSGEVSGTTADECHAVVPVARGIRVRGAAGRGHACSRTSVVSWL